jgi:hypothetical protein
MVPVYGLKLNEVIIHIFQFGPEIILDLPINFIQLQC